MRDFQLKYSTAMLLFIAGYMILGLALSAIESVKKLGVQFSAAGCPAKQINALSTYGYNVAASNSRINDLIEQFPGYSNRVIGISND